MNSLLGSTVFKLTLVYSLVFVAAVVVFGWLLGAAYLSGIDEAALEEQKQDLEWLAEVYAEGGPRELAEELGGLDEPLWDEDHAFFMLIEEGFAVLLLGSDYDPLLGYTGIQAGRGAWQTVSFFEGEESIEIRTLQKSLENDRSLYFAKTRNHEYFIVRETMEAGFFWLWVIVLPLALVTGFALSRFVFGRLDGLARAVDDVGHGSLDKRAPVRGNGDEFDRLAHTMNDMLDRIEALHRNLETASVGMAHDLKTPLSRLANRIHLMEQDLEDPEVLRAHLAAAHAQLNTVIQTFHGLLRLSEIESGQRRQSFVELDLSELARDVVESYEPVFADAQRALQVSLLPSIRLRGDSDLLVQMITNLLENSIEHGSPGGSTWIRLQTHPDGCVLQIGDDGPGVSADEEDRIFERFYRGDSSRTAPGNGLGLSIVKAVCELHGGTIVLLGQQSGAVFDCYLPVV
ncbi:MAG: HAMP domain-containing sensor histidine kinase [Pseudomonadota bacterium]